MTDDDPNGAVWSDLRAKGYSVEIALFENEMSAFVDGVPLTFEDARAVSAPGGTLQDVVEARPDYRGQPVPSDGCVFLRLQQLGTFSWFTLEWNGLLTPIQVPSLIRGRELACEHARARGVEARLLPVTGSTTLLECGNRWFLDQRWFLHDQWLSTVIDHRPNTMRDFRTVVLGFRRRDGSDSGRQLSLTVSNVLLNDPQADPYRVKALSVIEEWLSTNETKGERTVHAT